MLKNGSVGIQQGESSSLQYFKVSLTNHSNLFCSGVPTGQQPRGQYCDNRPLYIVRAKYNGELIPGYFNPYTEQAALASGGQEVLVKDFQVNCEKFISISIAINILFKFLIEKNVVWVKASNGTTPFEAIFGGRTANGETLYIGRVQNGAAIIPGKIQKSRGGLITLEFGLEKKFEAYEVLVYV